ncbi:MAG: type II secretion system protein GspG [Pseudobdellovibrio sp.]
MRIQSKKNILSNVRNNSGFSLGEIMIVLVIIGGIMAIILPKIADGNARSKVNTTKLRMSEIENKINEFNSECGKYPKAITFITEDDPSCKSWSGNPKMKHLIKDGWNNDFIFEGTDSGYNLKTLGADKKEGGTSFDKDFYSEGSQAAGE